jgi:hypothetical protein
MIGAGRRRRAQEFRPRPSSRRARLHPVNFVLLLITASTAKPTSKPPRALVCTTLRALLSHTRTHTRARARNSTEVRSTTIRCCISCSRRYVLLSPFGAHARPLAVPNAGSMRPSVYSGRARGARLSRPARRSRGGQEQHRPQHFCPRARPPRLPGPPRAAWRVALGPFSRPECPRAPERHTHRDTHTHTRLVVSRLARRRTLARRTRRRTRTDPYSFFCRLTFFKSRPPNSRPQTNMRPQKTSTSRHYRSHKLPHDARRQRDRSSGSIGGRAGPAA